MGNGNSSGSPPRSTSTARLIMLEGDLQEFFSPVKIFMLSRTTPGCFICNSDQMDFRGFPSAMRRKEELRPGQLYFELPLTWLSRRLETEDMVALAVKASVALAASDDVRCGCYHTGIKRRVNPSVFLNDDYLKPWEDLILAGGSESRVAATADVSGGVGKRKSKFFAPELSVILEE